MIPKQYEKAVFWGVAIAGGLLAFKLYSRGIGGTTRDLTAGVVGGILDAAGGIVAGGYDAIPEAIKPTNPDNVFYSGTNKIGAAVTGNKDFSLGVWLYDVTH